MRVENRKGLIDSERTGQQTLWIYDLTFELSVKYVHRQRELACRSGFLNVSLGQIAFVRSELHSFLTVSYTLASFFFFI